MSGGILDSLHPDLRIAWEKMGSYVGPASAEELEKLLKYFPDPPAEYLELIQRYKDLQIESKEGTREYIYFSLLSPLDVVSWLEWYSWLQVELPGSFFFAQDGDMAYFIGENEGREGVYHVQISAPDWTYADYIAPSIRAWLCDGVGWADKENL
ncbi:hypothetical protein [Deinococcus fonticola]|uniref:hypothetical protein n=1 Tax=Deinococcus fonticola TaxID=2528713 RepID=UPI001074C0EE|nr:hypothetical protein [Deinococcus fonticola]